MRSVMPFVKRSGAAGIILGLTHSVLYRTVFKNFHVPNKNRIYYTNSLVTFLGILMLTNSFYFHVTAQAISFVFSNMAYTRYVCENSKNTCREGDVGLRFGDLDEQERQKRR